MDSNEYMQVFLETYKGKFAEQFGELSCSVVEAFLANPRHLSVPRTFPFSAVIEDEPFPMMFIMLAKQPYAVTISQPSFVLLMLQVMKLEQKVGSMQEIGSGCGWLAFMLSHLADKVVGTEIFELFVAFSRQKMVERGIKNVEIRQAEFGGELGCRLLGPYDRIIASCAVPYERVGEVLDQLTPDGLAVIPVQIRTLPREMIPASILSQIPKEMEIKDLNPGITLLFRFGKNLQHHEFIMDCQFVLAL